MKTQGKLESRLTSFLLESAMKLADIVSADVFVLVDASGEGDGGRIWTGGTTLRSAFLRDGLHPRENDVEFAAPLDHHDEDASSGFSRDVHSERPEEEAFSVSRREVEDDFGVASEADFKFDAPIDYKIETPLVRDTAPLPSRRKRQAPTKHKTRLKPKFSRIDFDRNPLNLVFDRPTASPSPDNVGDDSVSDGAFAYVLPSPFSASMISSLPLSSLPDGTVFRLPSPCASSPRLQSGSSSNPFNLNSEPKSNLISDDDKVDNLIDGIVETPPPPPPPGSASTPPSADTVGPLEGPAEGTALDLTPSEKSRHVATPPNPPHCRVSDASASSSSAISGPKEDYYENITHSFLAMMSHFTPPSPRGNKEQPPSGPPTRSPPDDSEGDGHYRSTGRSVPGPFASTGNKAKAAAAVSATRVNEGDEEKFVTKNLNGEKKEAEGSKTQKAKGKGESENRRGQKPTHNRRPFTCSLCKKTFTRKDTCREHLKRIHFREVLHCNVCNMAFNSRQTMWFHRKKTGH